MFEINNKCKLHDIVKINKIRYKIIYSGSVSPYTPSLFSKDLTIIGIPLNQFHQDFYTILHWKLDTHLDYNEF